MKSVFSGKSIVVTGGTGSFGSYFVKEILTQNPKQVTIFSRDEDKQYAMQFELSKFVNKLKFVIGDVRDLQSLVKNFQNADFVIHAAALKQIPTSEYNISETIKTNVLGAQNVVEAALANNVSKVLSISTDKAVEPVNVMGMTKALQERIFILANINRGKSKTKFASVRYGNVANSRGSIIPLFKKQIEKGLSLTVTDLEMTRFILTLKEATGLVTYAFENMNGGEIFIPNIKALKIHDLAKVMIKNSGNKKLKVEEIGVRPGEKLHETLISATESKRAIKAKGYYILTPEIKTNKLVKKIKTKNKYSDFVYSSDKVELMNGNEVEHLLASQKIF